MATTATKIWTQLLGTSGQDAAHSIAHGLDGSIYLTGSTDGSLSGQTNNGGPDIFLAKYSANGTRLWSQLLGSTAEDHGTAVSTSPDGSIYVSGYTLGNLDGKINSGNGDAFLSKYSSDGAKFWSVLLGSSSNDSARALTIGLDGAIYIAGYTYGNLDGQVSNGQIDAFITKYDASGNKIWTKLSGTNGEEIANTLATGTDGGIYVGGFTQGNLDSQTKSGIWDAFVTKYDVNGNKIWTKLLGASSGYNQTFSLSTGPNGSVYATGFIQGSVLGQTYGGNGDVFLTKFSASGTNEWTVLLGSSDTEYGFGVTTGSDGSVYVTGFTEGNLDGQTSNGSADAFIAKYSSEGTKIWTKLLGTAAADYGYDITAGSNSTLYVTGKTAGSLDGNTLAGGSDIFLTAFQSGNLFPTGSVTISGTVTQGQTLTASNNLTDADGIPTTGGGAIKYQWKAGGVNIASATSSTYVLTQAEVGKAITVTASYTDLQGTAESVTSAVTQDVVAPSKVVQYTAPGVYLESNYQNIPHGSQPRTIEVSFKLAPSQPGGSLVSIGSLVKLGGLFEILVLPNGKPYFCGYDADLVSTKTISDDQWHSVAVSYNGTEIAMYVDGILDVKSTSSTPGFAPFNFLNLDTTHTPVGIGGKVSNANLFPGEIRYASIWNKALNQNEVQIDDFSLNDSSANLVATVRTATTQANSLPIGTVTTSGAVTQGQTLTASNNLTDADGIPTTGDGAIKYQWKAGGVNIASATSSTYVLTQAEVGKAITVTASYTDLQGTAESVTSAASAAVANVNDAPTGSITIAGAATQGQTLTASNNLTDADGIPSTGQGAIKYQWKAGGVAIAAATSSTYTLTQAEVGKAITVVASYTDLQGTAESVTSGATVLVGSAWRPVLALDFEGPDGSSSFGANITKLGSPVIDTAAKTQGQSSLYLAGDGSALIAGQSLNIGQSDFSIEFDFKTDGAQNPWSVMVSSKYEGSWGEIGNGASSAPGIHFANGGFLTGQNFNDGQWHRLAAMQIGSQSYLYVDGILQDQEPNLTVATHNFTDTVIGKLGGMWIGNSDNSFRGWIDNFSINIVNAGNSAASGAVYMLAKLAVPESSRPLQAGDITNSGTQKFNSANNHIYEYVDAASSFTWISAKAAAESKTLAGVSGHLVTITSASEQSFVLNNNTGGWGRWMGASDAQTEGQWKWVSGPEQGASLSGYTNWDSDEPNGTTGINSVDEDYGHFWPTTGLWNDAPNTGVVPGTNGRGELRGYVVEYSGKIITAAAASAQLATAQAHFTEDQTLFADASGLSDVDGLGPIGYRWQRGTDSNGNGSIESSEWTDISGAGTTSYTLGDADVGRAVRFAASYTDLRGTTETVYASGSPLIANINDVPAGAVTLSGTATQGQTLTASNNLTDADGIPSTGQGAIKYQWKAGGVAIAAATSSTYTLTQAEVGKAITVTASYTDLQGTAESVTSAASAAVANVNDAPSGAARMLSMDSVASTRALLASDITNASTQKFNAANSHVYEYVDANVTWTAAKAAAEAKTLAGLTGYLVTITSASEQSFVLTNNVTSVGRWMGASDAATEDAWRWVTGPEAGVQFWSGSSGGSTLNGAYNNWHSSEPNNSADEDYGHFWPSSGLWNDAPDTGIVIGTNSSGWIGGYVVEYSGTVSTTSISQVPSSTESHFTEDKTLHADGSLLRDPDGLGPLSYQWQRATDTNANGSIEASEWANIQSATATSYTLGDTDSGKYVRLAISYSDALGTQETVYSASSLIIKNINDAPTGSVTISGTVTQGQTLTASNNLTDADGTPTTGDGAIKYQWKAGGVAIAGAASSTYTLTQAEVGKAITVTASYTDLQGTAESVTSAATANVGNANDPLVGSATIAGTATQGQTLTASNDITDADGIPSTGNGAIKYQWKAGGVAIAGATGSTYTLTQAEVGKAITVVAGYTDLQGTAESVTSTASAMVANVNDMPAGSVIMTGTAIQSQDLVILDFEGSNGSTVFGPGITALNGATISTAQKVSGNSSAYFNGSGAALQFNIPALNIGAVDFAIDFYFKTDGAQNPWSVMMSSVREGGWGEISNGTARGGAVLFANYGDVSGAYVNDGAWHRLIAGQSGAESYLILDGVLQGKVTSTATSHNFSDLIVGKLGGMWMGNSDNSFRGWIDNLKVSLPSRSPTQGQTLTASNTLIDVDGIPTTGDGALKYQWKAGGANITGATSSTYTLTQDEVGKAITVTASYTDSLGTPESVTSAASAAVVNVNDTPTGSVALTGTATQGQTLTASNTLLDADGIPTTGDGALKYQWKAGGANITGATSSTYTLTQAEVGKAITVTASYTDSLGTPESVTSAASAAVVNVNDTPTGSVAVAGTATQGQTLTASNTLSDADGIPTTGDGAIKYQWKAGGVNITGAISNTYVLTQAEVGKAITVTAGYTDLQGTVESVTSTATLAVDGLPAGIEWSSANDLRTSESGTTAAFSARLSRAPLHPVTVELSISDATEGVFLTSGNAKLTLSFTAANWNTAQSITVMGYDDELRDGDVSYVISARTTSNDAAYDGLRNAQGLLFNGPTLINADDDAPVNWLGTEGNDTYASSSGDDDLYGYNGRDDLSGGKGHDRIYGGYGDDRLNGQEGNDSIEGEQGNDAIDGGAGNDRLLGGTGNDTLLGGDGDDVLDGDKDADTMDGGNGADLYYVDNPGDAVSDSGTDAAIDILYVASYLSAPVVLGAGIENATLDAAAGSGALVGNASNNSLKGNAADNQLNGGLGSDTLESGAGNDTVDAGDGDDLIVGGDGAGNDHYIGGSGQDTVRYTSAFNALLVNLLEGVASGQDIGSDTLSAIENLIGGKAGDTLVGDAQANVIDGHTGNDSITGGGGNDTLDGGEGQDTAVYALAAINYTVSVTTTGYQVAAQSGGEGIDQLRNVESLQFADRTGTAASFLTAGGGQIGNQAKFWKNTNITPGQANTVAAVNLNDAISVLKMIVGLPVNSDNTPLSPHQSIAADFNQNGQVGLDDAIGMLKLVVGLDAPAPTWRYYDADQLKTSLSGNEALTPASWSNSARIDDPTATGMRLVGVLTGDVDGSWVG